MFRIGTSLIVILLLSLSGYAQLYQLPLDPGRISLAQDVCTGPGGDLFYTSLINDPNLSYGDLNITR